VRLFVAIHPPEDCRAAYAAALDELSLPGGSWRPTPVAQVHLTLQFIGSVPERDLGGVVESVERSAAGLPSFQLVPQTLVTIPQRGPPRVIALTLDAPATMLEIKRRLVQRLARDPRRDDPDRFLPHITLGRFTGIGRVPRVEMEVSLPGFEVRSIVLFRSVLRPSGAEHSEVMRAGLLGPARGPS
jgi:2'-5' RNA ligase